MFCYLFTADCYQTNLIIIIGFIGSSSSSISTIPGLENSEHLPKGVDPLSPGPLFRPVRVRVCQDLGLGLVGARVRID